MNKDAILNVLHQQCNLGPYGNTDPHGKTAVEIFDDGTVSLNGHCEIRNGVRNLGIKFRRVTGDFRCGRTLLSLRGCPDEVGGDFSCSKSLISSLEEGPKIVNGDFFCFETAITSLRGSPNNVGGMFSCRDTRIRSLAGMPKTIGTGFSCRACPITSLLTSSNIGGAFLFTFNNDLGLLGVPLITCSSVHMSMPRSNDLIKSIVKKYQRLGKNSILAMAAELITAGYAANAKL